jgi:hypothetical protein
MIVNIPFVLYLDEIVNAITNYFSIHDSGNSNGYLIYAFMILVQVPLVFQATQTILLKLVYLVMAILIAVMNPFSFLTTPYNSWYLVGLTCILFPWLKVAHVLFQLVILLLLLAVATNEWLAFFYKPSFAFLAFVLFYLVGYGLFFITLTPERFRPLISFFTWIKNYIVYGWDIFVYYVMMIFRLPFAFLGAILAILGFALLHLYIRSISKQTYGGELLVHKPIPLDKVTSYKVPVNYHYTLSFWFYMYPSPPSYSASSTEYTNVLLHGDSVMVVYNGEKNKIEVKLKEDSMVEVEVPLQKWNHMVLIYTNGIMDTFMNGELIQSETWAAHTLTKELVIGANNGIHGNICSVMYFDNVKSHSFVQSLYKEFKELNPPIV